MRMAMMAMTTSTSTNVKPRRVWTRWSITWPYQANESDSAKRWAQHNRELQLAGFSFQKRNGLFGTEVEKQARTIWGSCESYLTKSRCNRPGFAGQEKSGHFFRIAPPAAAELLQLGRQL